MPLVERSARFFREEIWRDPAGALSPRRRALIDVLRVATIAVEGFASDLCTTRASALTFTSLFALVPVLAVSFAVLSSLGWEGDRLEALVLRNGTVLSPEAIATIVSYVDRVNVTGLGVIGAGFLVVTLMSLVTRVESAFNAIWDGVPARTLGRRITDYFGVMLVAPVLLLVAASLTAALESNAIFAWLQRTWGIGAALEWGLRYAAWPVVWLLFAFLYVFVPNTCVRLLPALLGAMIAGSVWQLTQRSYLHFQFGVANYNAVYGALAQLPLLMAWMYVSWVIVLLGAEIAHAIQTLPAYSRERRTAARLGQAFREWVALGVAVELARAALAYTAAPSAERLAQLLDVPLRMIREVLVAFESAGLAHSTADGLCFLSSAPELVSVARVLEACRGSVPPRDAHAMDSEAALGARALLETFEAETRRTFGTRSLRDVVSAETPPSRSVSLRAVDRQPPAAERGSFGKARKDRPMGPA